MKRGKCDSSICRGKKALTVYLNKILDDGFIQVDQERNTNKDILSVCFGNRVKVFVPGKEEKEWVRESRLLPVELYDVLYSLCENDNEEDEE